MRTVQLFAIGALSLLACRNKGVIIDDTAPPEGDTDTDTDTDTDNDGDTDADTDTDTDTDIDDCPAIAVDQTSLVWSGVGVGATEVQELAISNVCAGDTPLEVDAGFGTGTSDAFTGELIIEPLEPGETAIVTVAFTPPDFEVHTGLLELSSNDPDSPLVAVVLSGSSSADQDGDGYPAMDAGGTDCDDADPTVNPGADEIWYDGVDQDCDGASDFDQDGDGHDSADYGGDDCDDTDPSAVPGAGETVQDGLDDDCDGLVDEDFIGAGDIIVTEIMVNPLAVSDVYGEWFEVYNTTRVDIDMVGWVLDADDGDVHTVGSSLVVPARGYAVLGVDDDTSANGGVSLDYAFPRTEFSLADSGDSIFLYVDGGAIFDLSYTSRWPLTAGASLSLDPDYSDAAYTGLSDYWCEATSSLASGDLGTPGDDNDACSGLDHDGDGYSEDDGDCDDSDASISPDGTEVHDGVDNDCDGVLDNVTTDSASSTLLGSSGDYLGWTDGLALGDLDGDGQLDLMVGGYQTGSSSYGYVGGVHVVDGSGWASWADPVASVDSTWLQGGNSYNYLGAMGPTMGDQDGDGTDDLFVGGSDYYGSYYSGIYAAVLLYGSGISGDYVAGDADVLFEDGSSYGAYARTLSDLDVDGDGLDDLVYGDSYVASSMYKGAVSVMLGASLSTGSTYAFSTDADHAWTGLDSQDNLGCSLGGGDADADGYDDLLLAAKGADQGATGSGSVFLVDGASMGTGTDIETEAVLEIYGVSSTDALGQYAAPQLADYDGDGNGDIAVSSATQGQVYVFFDATSLSGSVSATTADVIITGDGPDYFGLTLRSGDLDADGQADLVVGAPDTYNAQYATYYADEPGVVYVFPGVELDSTVTLASDASYSISALSSASAFGMSITVGDISADGVDDLLVAAPASGSGTGSVFVFETP